MLLPVYICAISEHPQVKLASFRLGRGSFAITRHSVQFQLAPVSAAVLLLCCTQCHHHVLQRKCMLQSYIATWPEQPVKDLALTATGLWQRRQGLGQHSSCGGCTSGAVAPPWQQMVLQMVPAVAVLCSGFETIYEHTTTQSLLKLRAAPRRDRSARCAPAMSGEGLPLFQGALF